MIICLYLYQLVNIHSYSSNFKTFVQDMDFVLCDDKATCITKSVYLVPDGANQVT